MCMELTGWRKQWRTVWDNASIRGNPNAYTVWGWAELLLTKLQVVRLNEKDQCDILGLLYHHEVGDADGEMINGAYIGSLCATDWGLWRTCKMNLERSTEALPRYRFSDDERTLIEGRIEHLWRLIEGTPKSVKWKLRDRVGDRKQWYEEPEEVD